jgi:hypothetical protein
LNKNHNRPPVVNLSNKLTSLLINLNEDSKFSLRHVDGVSGIENSFNENEIVKTICPSNNKMLTTALSTVSDLNK